MKLFLTSEGLGAPLVDPFTELVGKPLKDVHLVLIENAADPYPQEKRGFVKESRERMEAAGLRPTLLDLREYTLGDPALKEALESADVVWLGGGNTFYLRWILKETGVDGIITDLIRKGKVYGGESAGSVIVGPSLEMVDKADDPSAAPEVILDGLGIVDVVIVPHWGSEKYQSVLEEIRTFHDERDRPTVPITNEQAFVIDGEEREVVP